MITESAIVTRCNGNQIELELQRGSACARCKLNQGCGTGALGRLLGQRSKPIVIESNCEVNPGDRLLLGMSESALVKTSLIVYGLPLLGMLLGGLFTAVLGASEILVASISVVGFIGGFKFATFLAKVLADDLPAPYIVDIDVNLGPGSESKKPHLN